MKLAKFHIFFSFHSGLFLNDRLDTLAAVQSYRGGKCHLFRNRVFLGTLIKWAFFFTQFHFRINWGVCFVLSATCKVGCNLELNVILFATGPSIIVPLAMRSSLEQPLKCRRLQLKDESLTRRAAVNASQNLLALVNLSNWQKASRSVRKCK